MVDPGFCGKETEISLILLLLGNQPSIMDAFSKKKATAKPRKATAAKSSESSTDEAASQKCAPPKMKKPAKRKVSSSDDSDSDFGPALKKTTAIKVCLPPFLFSKITLHLFCCQLSIEGECL